MTCCSSLYFIGFTFQEPFKLAYEKEIFKAYSGISEYPEIETKQNMTRNWSCPPPRDMPSPFRFVSLLFLLHLPFSVLSSACLLFSSPVEFCVAHGIIMPNLISEYAHLFAYHQLAQSHHIFKKGTWFWPITYFDWLHKSQSLFGSMCMVWHAPWL